MDSNSYNNLIKRISSDQDALTELYTYYYPRIVKYIDCRIKCNIGADVAQEFFLGLVHGKYVEYTVTNPTSWILCCAYRIALKHLKEKTLTTQIMENHEIIDITAITLESDMQESVAFAINQLEYDSRTVIYMTFWDGYNSREIAKILNIKPAAVRKRLQRAGNELKQIISTMADEVHQTI